jgi:hypothetical protein
MKSLIYIAIVIFFSFTNNKKLTLGGHKLTLQEAERILGERCQLNHDESSATNGNHQYKSVYWANSSNESSTKVALYFAFESFGNENDAQKVFEGLKTSNQNHAGFEILQNLGNEAFFHSYSQNFYLIITRKNNEIIRLKVNKITPKTSITELKKVASEVIARV